ncbi:MAG: transporter substrate-binding domain-containing protein [Thermoanaerobaculia bacterium]|nr:transporter substrate-binding domain-containing protein [Thermoanaerobaculia bacterium]
MTAHRRTIGHDVRRLAASGRGLWFVVLLYLVVVLLAALPLAAEKRVRVGLYENSPKAGIGDTGKPEGIFVDLLEAIAEAEGWSLDYVPGTWSEGLGRLAAGEIDLMLDVALTPEREQEFAFHREPVLSSWNQVYARRGSGIRSLPDLHGRRVAVLEGSVQQDLFRQMVDSFGFGVTLVPYPDLAAAFVAVAGNRADAVITNRFYGARHAAAAGLEDTAVIFAPSRLYFAAPKSGDPALLDAIDRNLVAFKADSSSVYFRSLQHWTTDEVRPALPRWLSFALLGGAALLAIAASWLILLRRQVAARTAIIRHRNEQLAIFNRTLRATGSSLDLRIVLEEATRGALELTDCDYGIVCVRDPQFEQFRVAARVHGSGAPAPAADSGPLNEACCPDIAEILAMGKRPAVLRVEAPGTSTAFNGVHDPALRWVARFPLEAQGITVGLLCLFSRKSEAPAPRHVDLVEELCVPVALAMENARLYEQAREHADELEERVEERTRELADAKHAAESADRLKSAFLATMSHELRTPLNSIIGFTGIVSQELAGPLNDEQKKQLGMVRESAKHLLALINDVLDISKIEAGELAVSSEAFDLPASIRKVAGIVGPLAEKKGLSLSIQVAEGVGNMLGDARRVEQVLLNLLGNAIKFTEAGSVALTVDLVTDDLPGKGELPRPAVRLRVADTGIGIKPEEMTQLFRPFRQIDSTLSRKHEGTGLGLAICRRLVALMGGHITADSRWGEGSVFTVVLPLCATEGTENA